MLVTNYSLDHQSLWNDTTDCNCTEPVIEAKTSWLLDELRLIKAVVLVIVVAMLLLSTCKILFQTFSKYDSGGDKKEDDN